MMFTSFLTQVTSYFNKRFIVTSFFPSFVIGGASLITYMWLQGFQVLLAQWLAFSAETKFLLSLIFFVAIFVVAYFLETFNQPLIRLFEGYWGNVFLLRRLEPVRRKFYARRFDDLKERERRIEDELVKFACGETNEYKSLPETKRTELFDRLVSAENHLKRTSFYYFPDDRELIMPTKLGNVLRAAELYPLRRYKIDAVILWPRLAPLLPPEFSEVLSNARDRLNLLLNLAFLSITYAFLWGGMILFRFHLTWMQFLVVNLLGFVGAWIAYKGVLQAAIAYGDSVRAAFDLYRSRLLAALNTENPSTYKEERRIWDEVGQFFYRGYPPHSLFAYENTMTPKQESEKPETITTVFGNKSSSTAEYPSRDENAVVAEVEEILAKHSILLPDTQANGVAVLFAILIIIAGYVLFHYANTPQFVPVLTNSVPAYHYLLTTDLSVLPIPRYEVMRDAVLSEKEIAERYTVIPIAAETQILESQLGPYIPEELVTGTMPVALEVSSAVVFGDQHLIVGQVVDLWESERKILTETLLIDIQTINEDMHRIILAVPKTLYKEIIAIKEPEWHISYTQ